MVRLAFSNLTKCRLTSVIVRYPCGSLILFGGYDCAASSGLLRSGRRGLQLTSVRLLNSWRVIHAPSFPPLKKQRSPPVEGEQTVSVPSLQLGIYSLRPSKNTSRKVIHTPAAWPQTSRAPRLTRRPTYSSEEGIYSCLCLVRYTLMRAS